MDGSYVVSKETGEVTTEMNPGDRIIRAKSIQYLEQHRTDTCEWKIENFYKGNTAEIQKLMRELTVYEKAFLFSIATYIGYEDCCLKYSNGKDITTEDLVEISGMNRSTVFEVINSLVNKDILYKGKNSKNRQYFMNPWLFCKGQRISKVLKTMFKNYRVRIYKCQRWGEIKNL
jgi:hypothetical protein